MCLCVGVSVWCGWEQAQDKCCVFAIGAPCRVVLSGQLGLYSGLQLKGWHNLFQTESRRKK